MLRYAIPALLLALCTVSHAAEHRIYVGTYSRGNSVSDGIYTSLFDDVTGTLSEPQLAVKADNPSFLAVHPTRDLLFSCVETADFGGESTGAVSAYRVDRVSGTLSLVNHQPTGGGAPCHCVVDATGNFLLVANYTGGNAAVFPISEDGRLQKRSSLINHVGTGPNKQRQEAPHAHSINLSSDNRFAYVADLGVDRVMIYRFDDEEGRIVPAAVDGAKVAPGSGPRHFSLHPNGRFAYSNGELTSVAIAFQRDARTGGLKAFQSVSTLPDDYEGRRSTAECLIHPSGRFLYISNRGHDSIASYAVDQQTGSLTRLRIQKTGGKEPRNFFIDPSGRWLLAENQNSDSVIVFSVNTEDGMLKMTDQKIDVGRPVCIRMLP